MKKITIFFVLLIIIGYIISGFIWGFNGLGAIIGVIILYFASNNKESRVAKEMKEAREVDLEKNSGSID